MSGPMERAVRRDLRALTREDRQTSLAQLALALAQLVDGECRGVCRSCDEEMSIQVDASARDMATVGRELRITLAELLRSAARETTDGIDDLRARRVARHQAAG